jgi:hypothetical protein
MQMKAEFNCEFIRYEYSADGEYCPDYRKYYARLDTVQLKKIKVGDQVFERPFAAGSMEAITAELALDLIDDVEFEEDV